MMTGAWSELAGADPLARPRLLLLGDPNDRPEGLERALIRGGFQVVDADAPPLGPPVGTLPDVVLFCLGSADEDLKHAMGSLDPVHWRGVPVVVTMASHQPDQVVRALALGATDALAAPIHLSELCARLALRIRTRLESATVVQHTETSTRLFEAFQDICIALRPEEILETLIQRLGSMLDVRHLSCILTPPGSDEGRAVAVFEDPRARDLVLDLNKYPEIVEAVQSQRTVFVPDLERSPLFESTRERWRSAQLAVDVQSVAAIPLTSLGKVIGVILLRTRLGDAPITQDQVTVAEALARATSRVLESEERRGAIYRRQVSAGVADALTGCGTLDALDTRIREEFERAKRYDLSFSLVLLDVDGLREYNARLGMEGGDRLLADLGALFQREIRAPDFVARYSGDEFALVLPETDLAGARQTVERVRRRIALHAFRDLRAGEHPELSAGIAAYPHPAALSTEDMFALAETALLDAKEQLTDRIGTAAPVAA
ncbi:MAG TPA: diguanylate cyclase [Gemmatimonadales bacterium]|nr:diguanylate cyclase [Gemmatimonadales bacterium]